MPGYEDEDFDPAVAATLTEEAIRERAADVIYQAYLVSADGRWRGFADFLERRPDGTYEPVDTKLARRPSRRTCSSSASTPSRSRGIQGAPVEHVHVENGPRRARELPHRRVPRLLPARARAVPRRARARGRDVPLAVRALRALRLPQPLPARGSRPTTTSSLVAGMRRGWVERLLADGIDDARGSSATLPPNGDGRPHGLRPESFEKLRHQAELQLRGRVTGTHLYELLADEEERGFRLLPEPDRRRRLARPRGPPVLRARARARVPLRLLLPRRRRRGALRGALGARPRRRAGGLRASSSTGSSSAAAGTPGCTSTTTPPTSAPPSRA